MTDSIQSEKILAEGEDFSTSYNKRTKFLNDSLWPMGVREIVTNAPDNRKSASLFVALTCLCVLAPRVRLRYVYDRRESALLVQLIIEGTQSSGKSFAADIENMLLEHTIKKRDQAQRRLEQEYREKKRRKGANDRMGEEPKTTIQVLPPSTSKAVITRRADAFEKILGDTMPFFMSTEELQSVSDANKNTFSDLRTIMRTAYDLGSKIGFDYYSDNSFSAIVDINIVFMACTTPAALDAYMNNSAIEGGNITRIVRVPLEESLGEDAARFKPYTPEQMARINKMLELMTAKIYNDDGSLKPTHCLDTAFLDKTVQEWCRAQGRRASLDGSISRDVFRKRCSSSAYRYAALCYYLYGLENSVSQKPLSEQCIQKRCRQIYLSVADYVLDSMLDRWGAKFEELNSKRTSASSNRRDKGLYDLLTDEFTRDQISLLVEQMGLSTPVRQFIYTWKCNDDIEIIDKNHFRKKGAKHEAE